MTTVTMPIEAYEQLKQAESQVKELKAKVKELQSPNHTKAIYDGVYRVMVSIFEGIQREQHTIAAQLEADAELGRLVRAMDYSSVCLLEKTENAWNAISRAQLGVFDKYYADTPEEALKAAGVQQEENS